MSSNAKDGKRRSSYARDGSEGQVTPGTVATAREKKHVQGGGAYMWRVVTS